MKFSMIAAIDSNSGIGQNGKIPWYIPEDLKYFQEVTKGNFFIKKNVVIMGRLTWESLPKRFRPLKGRINLIVSSQPEKVEDHDPSLIFSSFQGALDYCQTLDPNMIGEVFIVGGQRMYEEGIQHPDCQRLYLTEIKKEYDCDRFFPKVDRSKFFSESQSLPYHTKDNVKYVFKVYKRVN